jgi:hypothetical protein
MTQSGPASVTHMTAGQGEAPGQGVTITRPRHHIENVRQDAIQAAERRAAQTGAEPSHLINDTISWALGDSDQAPFTSAPTPGGPTPTQLSAEIKACRAYLQSTPGTNSNADSIHRANHVLKILEWLTGADDKPPTYRRETEPGDLVGGRGRVVRPYITIRFMVQEARKKIETGQTSHGFGADWHRGVIATLLWTEGERATPPMAHEDSGWECDHSDSEGVPTRREIARERGAAEEHLEPLGFKHGDIAAPYADAVACTIRWLYGETTTPPVTDDF